MAIQTIVVGDHWYDNATGAAYVFVRDSSSNNHWTLQAKLMATDDGAAEEFFD